MGESLPKPLKCTIRDGRFVEPCGTLDSIVANPFAAFSRAKGVTRWQYTNLQTHEPSRTFFGIKTKEHPNGLLFNVCPFCGERIDAPFAEKEPTTPNTRMEAGDEGVGV